MSVLPLDENRINGFEPSSSVNGRENTSEKTDVLKITDWGRRVADNELGHKADLRESVLRRETRNAEAESFVIERPLHSQDASTSGFRVGNRRKSEGQSLLKATLTPQFTNTRRRSTSELERKHDNRSTRNSRSTLPQTTASVVCLNKQNQGNTYINEESATSPKTEHSIYGNNRVEGETLAFPAMSGVNTGVREEYGSSSPAGWTHRKDPKGNWLNNGESATAYSKRLVHFDKDFPTHKISLPDPGKGTLSWNKVSDQELTRGRSFSDSEVDDSVRMSAEQREKLKHLKYQILEKNVRRKYGRKVSGVKQSAGSMETRFPVLTEKSLMRYSRCHETANGAGSLSAITADQTISALIDPRTKVNPVGSEFAVQNQDSDIQTADKIARNKYDISLNTEQTSGQTITSGQIVASPSSILAYSENNQVIKRKSNESDIPTPPNSEEGDFESISVVIERLRARSEPGDIGTRKVSTVYQLQNRVRSETDELKTKVQSFVKKPLPALPPSTLRVKKQALDGVASKAGHFKAGANSTFTSERPSERKEGVINIHTCPNMNLFSDKSWMYQDESRKRHRYIRGPATPVPPVDFVFNKNEPDTS